MENPKRARSWKRRLRPRVNLKNDVPVLYSTYCPLLSLACCGSHLFVLPVKVSEDCSKTASSYAMRFRVSENTQIVCKNLKGTKKGGGHSHVQAIDELAKGGTDDG